MNGHSKLIGALLFLIFFISLIGIGFADLIPSTEPCWVKGTVTGSGVTVEGLTVSAYKGTTLLKSATITDSNYSLNSVGANTSDTITLKVYGADFNTFTFEGYCKTGSDPWVVKNFTVSKKANDLNCTSSSICNSGYCTGTTIGTSVCATAATVVATLPGGGSSSGSSTTTTESTTTISETTEEITYTPAEMQTALEGMKDESGNQLFSNSEITEMVANSSNYQFERNVLVEKVVSSTGTNYKVTVTTSVKNKATNELKDVKVVIEVPKQVSTSASTVQSLIPFTVLVNDPVLQFNLSSLKAGETADIIYTVTSATKPDLNNAKFADPSVLSATKVTAPSGTAPPGTTPPGTAPSGTTPPSTAPPAAGPEAAQPMDWTWIILLVVVIIIVAMSVSFFMSKKSR